MVLGISEILVILKSGGTLLGSSTVFCLWDSCVSTVLPTPKQLLGLGGCRFPARHELTRDGVRGIDDIVLSGHLERIFNHLLYPDSSCTLCVLSIPSVFVLI